MVMKLYELCGKDEARRFSPFVWRTRLALAHKGLAFEGIPWRFTDKEAIAFTGQGKVPVLVDGDNSVFDSWEIALYLDKTYADRPRLIPEGAEGLMRTFNTWADTQYHSHVRPLVLMAIMDALDEKDATYFRETREALFKVPLEEVAGPDPLAHLPAFRNCLQPVRATLSQSAFMGGEAPNYADHIVMASIMWIKTVTPLALFTADDPLFDWCNRMLAQYDGEAGKAPGFPFEAATS